MRFKLIFSIIIFFIISTLAFGQVNPDCPPGHPDYPDCLNPPKAPITETIILLLAGGMGLGIKTMSKKKKKN